MGNAVGGTAVAAGVFEQIGKDAGQFGLVGNHPGIDRDPGGDADVLGVAHRGNHAVDQGRQHHRGELDLGGPRVVHELVDDRVELIDVGRHIAASFLVGDADFGFQSHARQRRAQIV